MQMLHQHWFALCRTSGGILSFLGDFLQVRQPIALVRSSWVGRIVDRHGLALMEVLSLESELRTAQGTFLHVY